MLHAVQNSEYITISERNRNSAKNVIHQLETAMFALEQYTMADQGVYYLHATLSKTSVVYDRSGSI